MRQEFLEKAEFRRLPMRPGGPGRQIQADHGQLAKIGAQIAAFAIELGAAEAIGELRLHPRIDANPA
jgi:hypothetical protein